MKSLIVNRKLVNPCNEKIVFGKLVKGGGYTNREFTVSSIRTNSISYPTIFVGFRIVLYKKDI